MTSSTAEATQVVMAAEDLEIYSEEHYTRFDLVIVVGGLLWLAGVVVLRRGRIA